MHLTVPAIVKKFNLLPHPEGGYYKETYRSAESMAKEALPDRFGGPRPFSTAIYFLLESGNFSAFHRIKSDECWHFYAGDTLHVHVIYPDGHYSLLELDNQLSQTSTCQAIVPAGAWFASETAQGGNFSLVGCTVSPGFDFADFELAKSAELTALFPMHATLIQRLCRI